jgi:hypothetical protein
LLISFYVISHAFLFIKEIIEVEFVITIAYSGAVLSAADVPVLKMAERSWGSEY